VAGYILQAIVWAALFGMVAWPIGVVFKLQRTPKTEPQNTHPVWSLEEGSKPPRRR